MGLSIDVVSDVVCPWCLIGITRLNQALGQLGLADAEVKYHPFLLDPTTPEEGVDLRERLQRKYGVDPRQMFARVEGEARRSGIDLDFSRVRKGYSTVKAHTLLRHAAEKGTQGALKLALLKAYFLEGQDISAVDTLAQVSAPHGFARAEVEQLLGDPAQLDHTRMEAEGLRDSGVTGVPFTILGGRLALSGAQPVESFVQALRQALAEPADVRP